ncbi:MAG: GNAT family N-acetyltransferase [Candidatus Heimdallarchaeota archaeon]|nr:GNAT family N-acetyltransferase [Candidatus Heimdallarchaeota archaeon]
MIISGILFCFLDRSTKINTIFEENQRKFSYLKQISRSKRLETERSLFHKMASLDVHSKNIIKEILYNEKMEIIQLSIDEVDKAIACIHSASERNKLDYPPELIDHFNYHHYNRNWLLDKLKIGNFFVARENNEIIGTISHKKNEITNLFVTLAFQGQGIGKELMSFIEEKIISLGYTDAQLNANISSVDFYKALGYQIILEQENLLRNWTFTGFVMYKDLH